MTFFYTFPFIKLLFLISLPFLIFDFEVIMSIPMIYNLYYLNFPYMIVLIIVLLLNMLITLIFEWMVGYPYWL